MAVNRTEELRRVAMLYARREGADEVRVPATPRTTRQRRQRRARGSDPAHVVARQAKVARLSEPARPPAVAKGPRSEFDDAVRSIVRPSHPPPSVA
jgi:hypothetical protein